MATVTRITHVLAPAEEVEVDRVQVVISGDGRATRTRVTWVDDAGAQDRDCGRVTREDAA